MYGLLENQGLTDNEIKVYRMLLDYGPSHAGQVSRRTGIHRRNVYDCLDRLTKKGLVGYILQNNRKLYSITNPKRILERLEQEQEEWSTLMPELLAKYDAGVDDRETLFFRGKPAVKQVFEDQIAIGEEILVNATNVEVSQVLRYFFPKYQLMRKEKKIPTRMLFDKTYRTQFNKAKLAELPLCNIRYLDGLNETPTAQYIYGDNIAIVVWTEIPIAILIRQKEVAECFRNTFELLWKNGKE